MNPQQVLMIIGQSIQIVNDNIYRMAELANYLNNQAKEIQKQVQEMQAKQREIAEKQAKAEPVAQVVTDVAK